MCLEINLPQHRYPGFIHSFRPDLTPNFVYPFTKSEDFSSRIHWSFIIELLDFGWMLSFNFLCCPSTGRSQRFVDLQRRRGTVCLPEDGVSTDRDAVRGILDRRRQEFKIIGAAFGNNSFVFRTTSVNCSPLLPKSHRLNSTPTHLLMDRSAVGVQILYREYLFRAFSLLWFYPVIALYGSFLRCRIAFNHIVVQLY